MAAAARLSLNTMTVREQWNLREAIEGCVRHGIAAIAPWRDQLDHCGVSEAATLLADHGLAVSSLCRGGMFTAPDAAGRMRALDDNRRAVDDASAIGAHCLVLVVGGLPAGSKDLTAARGQVRDALGELLEHARASRMPLALEPLHPMYAADRACVNTLAQALDLCDALGDGLGVVVDVYHTWWDPDLEAQIARAGNERILGYHVSDWLVPTRDLLLDRGMMGDGVIDLPRITAAVERAGYRGFTEVEIMSVLDWWKRDPDEVVAICQERMQTAVGTTVSGAGERK